MQIDVFLSVFGIDCGKPANVFLNFVDFSIDGSPASRYTAYSVFLSGSSARKQNQEINGYMSFDHVTILLLTKPLNLLGFWVPPSSGDRIKMDYVTFQTAFLVVFGYTAGAFASARSGLTARQEHPVFLAIKNYWSAKRGQPRLVPIGGIARGSSSNPAGDPTAPGGHPRHCPVPFPEIHRNSKNARGNWPCR